MHRLPAEPHLWNPVNLRLFKFTSEARTVARCVLAAALAAKVLLLFAGLRYCLRRRGRNDGR